MGLLDASTTDRARVLIVDDDASMVELLGAEIEGCGLCPIVESDPGRVLASLQSQDVDVVVTDLRMAGINGLELCERIVAVRPDVPVIILTAHGELDAAVAALRVRAFDFLAKPPDVPALVAAIERGVRHRRLASAIRLLDEASTAAQEPDGIIGSSPPMRELMQLIGRVAAVDATVLIRGESGTGKELVASALHDRSPRRGRAFVALNCAALPDNLLEAELFGYVKGAFTDASRDRRGLFERARGGTLFLDEIGELNPMLQPKLLRALQEKRIRPVGSDREVEVDVRILTATNIDLENAVQTGRFRSDLFYRLNVIEIVVPPLRERGHDVLLLAQSFVERTARNMRRDVVGLTASCAARLMAYAWPGNVRELANAIERAVALTRTSRLTVDDLPDPIRTSEGPSSAAVVAEHEELVPLEELERRYIRRVMVATGGNKTLAAKILGVDRRTLYRKDWAAKPPKAEAS